MNIVFWLLVVIALVLIWFGCASIFGVIGRSFKNMIDNAKENIEEDDEDESW